MEVELYIEEEKASLISEPEEWLAKVTSLGLEKQAALMKEEGKGAVPFLRMDRGLRNVFETLCPREVSIDDFNAEPIPLMALSMYALAVREKYFDMVQIWHNENEPDPIMVGIIKQGEWGKDYFLMARWGPEKQSFDQLRERAMTLWVAKKAAEWKRQIADLGQKLSVLEELSRQHMSGDTVY
jgi:hypothetical protein